LRLGDGVVRENIESKQLKFKKRYSNETLGEYMKRDEIIAKLKELKIIFLNDGFFIDGVFGSYARGDFDNNSDIDILYHLENPFFEKYSGFIGFKRLDEIKNKLNRELNKNIDLAPINNLSKTGKEFILSEVIYV